MYIPKQFDMPDRDAQLRFMRAHGFCGVVSHVAGVISASHVPVRALADEATGAVRLAFHLAKANPQSAALLDSPDVLVIFNGPHAYISPTNYDKIERVPTWNYVAVHVTGRAVLVDDPAAKLAMLDDLLGTYEGAMRAEWAAMSPKYREGMLAGIVAFEVEVFKLEGKTKVSQNQAPADQARVADWLEAQAHPDPKAIAGMIRRNLVR